MATIQQLEKLYAIQRLFYVSDSLESVVAGEKIQRLINRTEQLLQQRAFLREERRKIRIQSERLEVMKKSLAIMSRKDWIPLGLIPPVPPSIEYDNIRKVYINVGGLMFSTFAFVLQRDKVASTE